MTNEFVLYQKFPDIESAESFSKELVNHGIVCHFENSEQTYVKVVGFNPIDLPVSVNIRQKDFSRADEILTNFYKSQLDSIDDDYYLFDFNDEELQEILLNQHEWGRLDYQLAKQILKNRGIQIDEEYLLKIDKINIEKLSEVKEISKLRLVLYYLFCFIFPPYSMVNGFLIVHGGSILPDGQKVYTRTATDRIHGKIIIGLSIGVLLVLLFFAMIENSMA